MAAVLVLGPLLLSGCGEEKTAAAEQPATNGPTETSPRTQPRQRIIARLPLTPVRRQPGGQPTARGTAVITQRGRRKQLAVQATLRPTANRSAYVVWLYNSRTDAKSLGAQVTDRQGTFQGAGPLPANYRRYKYVDISRENVGRFRTHYGRSVLRGRLP